LPKVWRRHAKNGELVREYAGSLGLSERELSLLLDAGYSATDIELMLYDDEFREQCMQEVLCDNGDC
jgi:hypothetical protein